jgi:predicted DNA-binding transcriptional regulator AlpA
MSAENKKRGQRGPRRAPQACGPVVWDVPAWCAQLGIGRSTFYTLEPKPKAIRIGKLCRVIEAPSEYTRRIAEMQDPASKLAA